MFRRLVATALCAALVACGLAACCSKPPCHHCHTAPLESAWVCPVDGSLSDAAGLCEHCGAVRIQKSTSTQTWVENRYSVK